MKIHNLQQGSPEWLAHRRTHFNASDAPAMMGCSPHKTRTQLLHEMHTGMVPDVDAATQRRFDDGHRFEALARPLAEEIIGEDLFPVTGTSGKLSASFDGLTMDKATAFEHKTLNSELRALLIDGCLGSELPMQYRVQMEHQCMVSGSSRVLFMASKWDGDELVEVRHCWYTPDPELLAKIGAGWNQFEQDLAAYVPVEVIVAPVAVPQMGLPAVAIQVTGSIALVDNLDKFGTALEAYVKRINKQPETDQDFADLEATVKTLKTAEEALDAAEAGALAQTDSIDTMRKTVALYRETARSNRLLIEKLVKAEKENRRTAIISDAAAEFVVHIKKLNERLGRPYMPAISADFQGVVKGLKSLDSMKDKVSVELARCKIEADAIADRIQVNLETKGLHGYGFLFADIATLCLKPADDFANMVAARIAAHEAAEAAKEEATRERIRAEEQAKAERDARANLAKEQAAEAARVAEEAAKVNRDAQAATQAAMIDAITSGTGVTKVTAFVDEGVQIITTHVPFAALSEASNQADEPVQIEAQAVRSINVVPMAQPAIQPVTTPPTLKLGEISARLAPISITADGLASLGFKHAATAGVSKLFHEADFGLICAALVAHIEAVQAKLAA